MRRPGEGRALLDEKLLHRPHMGQRRNVLVVGEDENDIGSLGAGLRRGHLVHIILSLHSAYLFFVESPRNLRQGIVVCQHRSTDASETAARGSGSRPHGSESPSTRTTTLLPRRASRIG